MNLKGMSVAKRSEVQKLSNIMTDDNQKCFQQT